MDTLLVSWFKDAPGIAGVIIIVVLFLRYITKRDKDWQNWMTEHQKLNAIEMKKIDLSIANLEKVLLAHDEWERATIEDKVKIIFKKRIRKRKQISP